MATFSSPCLIVEPEVSAYPTATPPYYVTSVWYNNSNDMDLKEGGSSIDDEAICTVGSTLLSVTLHKRDGSTPKDVNMELHFLKLQVRYS